MIFKFCNFSGADTYQGFPRKPRFRPGVAKKLDSQGANGD